MASLWAILLAAPSVHAGTYFWQTTDPSTGKMTAQSPSFSGGTAFGLTSGPRGPFNGPIPYSSSSSNTYGGGGGRMNSPSCSGAITATLTWQADPAKASDPPPPSGSVVVMETSTASASAQVGANATCSATCDDGMGQSGSTQSSSGVPNYYNTATPPQPTQYLASVSTTDTRYTASGGATITLTLSPSSSATASASNGPGGWQTGATVSYTVSVYPVTITPSGTTLDASGNQNILVGQGCTGNVSGLPGGTGWSTPTYQWNVSGTTFQDWQPTTQGDQYANPPIPANPNASYYNPGPGDQTQSTYHWFWNDPGPNSTPETITCTATVTPPAGQGSPFSVTATQKVTVYVPSWVATNATGYGYVGYPHSPQDLYLFAGPSAAMQQNNQKDGSVWDTTVSSPIPAFMGAGLWAYAQIIDPGEYFYGSDGSMGGSTDTGIPALDNTFPYEGTHALDGGKQEDSDAPALPLIDPFARAILTDQFKTYLMFRPSGSDTRWVPLAESGWNTYFDAKEPGTGHWADYPANTSTGPVLLIFNFKPQNVPPSWNKVDPKGRPLIH